MLVDIHGCVVRQCKLWECQGGISIGRQAHLHVVQCEFRDVTYGVRCMQNAKVRFLDGGIYMTSDSLKCYHE